MFKKLTFLAGLAVCFQSSKAQVNLSDKLVGHYDFASNLNEETGKNASGTGTSLLYGVDRFGQANEALYLNGTAMADLGNVPLASANNTVAFWIKTNAIAQNVLSKRAACNANTPFFDIRTSNLGYINSEIRNSAGSGNAHPAGFLNNAWTHIAFVMDSIGKKTITYMNGKKVNSLAWAVNIATMANTASLKIASTPCASTAFTGLLDDLYLYNKALNEQEIKTLFDEQGVNSKTANTRTLVAYVAMDTLSSNNLLETTETLVGVKYTSDRNGKPKSAYYFDGAQYADLGNVAMSGVDYTIAMWMRPDDFRLSPFFSKRDACTAGFFVDFSTAANGGLSLETLCSSSATVNVNGTGDTYTPGTWKHVAVVFDGKTESTLYYVNGKLFSTKPWTGAPGLLVNTSNLVLGKSVCTNRGYFKGAMDELFLINKAVDSTAIKAIYNTGKYPNADSVHFSNNELIAKYSFSGSAVDESGRGNDGLINGATLTTDRFNNPNSAYLFDGVNDQISFGDIPFNDYNGTINFWMQVDNYAPGAIMSKREVCTNGHFFDFYMTKDSIITFEARDDDGNIANYAAATALKPGKGAWKMVTVIMDKLAKETRVYLNGVLQSTRAHVGTPSDMNNTASFVLGVSKCNSGGDIRGYFKGKLDDIIIYNKVLNGNQVTSLYQDNVLFVEASEESNSSKLVIYPNPSSGTNVALSKTGNWKLYDSIGILTKQGSGNIVSLESLPNGVYTIVLLDDSTYYSEQLVKY